MSYRVTEHSKSEFDTIIVLCLWYQIVETCLISISYRNAHGQIRIQRVQYFPDTDFQNQEGKPKIDKKRGQKAIETAQVPKLNKEIKLKLPGAVQMFRNFCRWLRHCLFVLRIKINFECMCVKISS